MKLKVGDNVKVIAGKDKGKSGEITKVDPVKKTVLVKGINIYKRHLKSREGIEGGIYPLERPLDVSKVALIDPTNGEITRVGYKILPSGKKVRISKKTGVEIDNVKAKAKETKKKTTKKKKTTSTKKAKASKGKKKDTK